jgi:uncharacterized tellurite resistance protein B-like protein
MYIENNSVDAVLRMLMTVIYADHIVHPSEISALQKVLPNLTIFSSGSLSSSENVILEKFKSQKIIVAEGMTSGSRDKFVDESIHAIDDPYLGIMILSALHEIARADNELHIDEVAIIQRASSFWGHD